MGFIDCASNASIWRGYEYYETKQVKSWTQVDKTKYEDIVNYVNSLSVEQLRLELIQALMEKEDDDFYW